MSHFTSVKVKMNNMDTLKVALAECGYNVTENGQVVGDTGRRKADLVITGHSVGNRTVGFTLTGDEVNVEADWYYVRTSQTAIMEEIQRKYTLLETKSQLEARGFTLGEVVQEGDELVLTATCWS